MSRLSEGFWPQPVMHTPLSRVASTAALALSLAGCAAIQQPTCSTGEQLLVHETLYFGTAKPAGVVTQEDWAEFLKAVVTPRFPQGLTFWRASGQWRGSDGAVVRETSHVLNVLHPNEAPHETAVLEIVAAYKSRFRQEAVLRVKAHACTSF